MFDAVTTEMLLSLATTAVSGLSLGGIVLALNATRHKQDHFDIDQAVQRAPYARLHNVVLVGGK